jgi:hypothetical protein
MHKYTYYPAIPEENTDTKYNQWPGKHYLFFTYIV